MDFELVDLGLNLLSSVQDCSSIICEYKIAPLDFWVTGV